MAQKRKYKIKAPQVVLAVVPGEEELVQQKVDEVFDYIFSKIELEHLQSLSYNDKRTGENND
jgi:hypothetical protein